MIRMPEKELKGPFRKGKVDCPHRDHLRTSGIWVRDIVASECSVRGRGVA